MKKILIIACLLFSAGLVLAGCGQPININVNSTPTSTEPPNQPVTGTVPAGWQTFTDAQQGIIFRYPDVLPTTYIHVQSWPPKVAVAAGKLLSCATTSPANRDPNVPNVIEKVIQNNAYCVKSRAEGAAGTYYTDYTYFTVRAGKIIALSFTIREPRCANYDDPQQTVCEQEQRTYDLDGLIDNIVNTMNFSSAGSAPVACTAEAKLCPDGSAVGRTGPNCEFAPCPGQ